MRTNKTPHFFLHGSLLVRHSIFFLHFFGSDSLLTPFGFFVKNVILCRFSKIKKVDFVGSNLRIWGNFRSWEYAHWAWNLISYKTHITICHINALLIQMRLNKTRFFFKWQKHGSLLAKIWLFKKIQRCQKWFRPWNGSKKWIFWNLFKKSRKRPRMNFRVK